MSERSNVAFNKLREPCIALSTITFLPPESFNESTKELQVALVNVRDTLKSLGESNKLSQKLGDYVFVPIVNLLKQSSLSNLTIEYVLEILEQILRLFWNEDGTFHEDVAKQLFQIITFLIGGDQENKGLQNKTSDFKLVSVKLLKQFYDSLGHQKYSQEFFKNNIRNLTIMSHSVTICLDILKTEPYIVECQLEALEALIILYSKILRDGETLSYILPGNISSITIVLSKPGLETNSKVVIKGLEVLKIILTSVYNDEELRTHIASFDNIWKLIAEEYSNAPDTPIEKENIENKMIQKDISPLKVHRDISWLKGTSAQVKVSLKALLPRLSKRNDINIRNSLGDFVTHLLKSSSNSLYKCHDIFIQLLVAIKLNPDDILRKYPIELKANAEMLIDKIQSSKLDELKDVLEQLVFSLDILGESSNEILTDEGINAIYSFMLRELKTFSEKKAASKIIEHKSDIILAENWINNTVVQKQNFPEVFGSTENDIRLFLNQIGQILIQDGSSLDGIVSKMLSTTENGSIIEKTTALWICNSISYMKSGENSRVPVDDFLSFDSISATQEVIQDYPSSTYELLEYSRNFYESIEMETEYKLPERSQEIAICTTLSTIENVANLMKDDFSDELIDYIYVVIDNLASSSPIIREFAQNCATTIANLLYEGSVSDMIKGNIDYIIDSISMRLHSGMTQRVSMVLMVICRLAGYESIITFKDIIEMLFKLLDYYHGYAEICIQFFQVFEVIVLEMKKQYLSQTNGKAIEFHLSNKSTFSPWGLSNIHGVADLLTKEIKHGDQLSMDMDENAALEEVDNFKDYVATKMNIPDSDDEEEDDQDMSELINEVGHERKPKKKDEEEWKSPIPVQSYRILLQIVSYGDRLLTHPSKDLKIHILRVLSLIWPMLATQYSSLLPQIAQSWDSVTSCILENNYAIVDAACTCTMIMIQNSGDFISKRFIDLWKTVKKSSYILKEVQVSTLDGSIGNDTRILVQGSHKFPPITKNALTSLSKMIIEGILCTELLLSDTDIYEMINCCLKVLPKDVIIKKSLYLGDLVQQIAGN